MIRNVPTEAVLTGVVAKLKASSGVTNLVTGVYNNVPTGTVFPYIEVTSPAERRLDTAGRYGSEMVVNVKAVSQGFGDQEAARIHNACVQALNQQPITTAAPHTVWGISWDNADRYSEVVNGVTTRYHVGIFRVNAEQTS